MVSHRLRRGWPYLALAVVLGALLFPVAWMVDGAFKPRAEFFVTPPQWIPNPLTLQHFQDVIGNPSFPQYASNSAVITGSVTIVGTILAVGGGYALSRCPIPGRRVILLALLGIQVFPQTMFLIPLFRTWAKLDLLSTPLSISLSQLTLVLPLSIWLMASFFDKLPEEVEEAAAVDGARPMRILVSITLPLALPGIVVVSLFILLSSWDEYLYTSTLAQTDSARTLAVGMVAQYFGQYSYFWDKVMAMSVLLSLPMAVVFLSVGRHFIQGLTAGYSK